MQLLLHGFEQLVEVAVFTEGIANFVCLRILRVLCFERVDEVLVALVDRIVVIVALFDRLVVAFLIDDVLGADAAEVGR